MASSTYGSGQPDPGLEAQFHAECDEAVNACAKLSPPYHPTAWIAMVAQWGASEAARRLVVSGDVQTGFGRLVTAGRPELTIEWMMLDPKWDPLFRDQRRDAARWRLRQAGIEPPD
ncbi:hypothetical protein [Cryptosporangium sp. NPDC051539]|uniref:hypothetical protein n=1 Tax=Cryptosporangium sp. NPDC051539 TaxID=3363962 RepID=UPI0037BCB3C6